MPEVIQKKVGIIFIVNYFIYTDTTQGKILSDHITDIETGFFNLSDYKLDNDIEYCFIKSTRKLDEKGNITKDSNPQTIIYKPIYDHGLNKYTIGEGATQINLGNINLGNYDVLSTVLIMAKNLLKASEEFIIVTYWHASPFGSSNGSVDETSSGAKEPGIGLPKDFENFKFSNHVLKYTKDYISGRSNYAFVEKSVNKIALGELAGVVEEIKAEPIDSIETFKPDMLTNAEQYVALERAFDKNENKKIRLLINCGCYVQNTDALFSLRQVTDYIVAVSSSIPELSYNFAKLINENIANKTRVYETIAYNIVEDYKYLETLQHFTQKFPDLDASIKTSLEKQNDFIVLSAVDCKHLNVFFNLFNDFILLLINRISEDVTFEEIRAAKVGIESFEMEHIKIFVHQDEQLSPKPFYMYDLKIFIESLIERHPIFREKTKSLIDFLDNKVILRKKISELLIEKSGKQGESWGGIAFYFPDQIVALKELSALTKFYSVFSDVESFFSQNGYLQEFIFLYHKRLKLSQKK